MASLNPLAEDIEPNPNDDDEEEVQQRIFHQFSLLHEDVQIFVLAFVAHVPFEDGSIDTPALLTHVLPYVSHQFHAMSQSNVLWKQALERLVRIDAPLWTAGLQKVAHPTDFATDKEEDMVKTCHEALNDPGYYQMFQMIVERHLRFTSPVFIMSGVLLRLGEGIALHFSQPRHRLLISRVLEGYPQQAKEGNPISANEHGEYPTFVCSGGAPFAPSTPACLVRVQQCTVHPNGCANVLLIPTAYVTIERLWEDAGTGRLRYAQCLRMSGPEERHLEENRQIPAPMRFEIMDGPTMFNYLVSEAHVDVDNGNAEIPLNYLIHEHGDDDEDEDGVAVPVD